MWEFIQLCVIQFQKSSISSSKLCSIYSFSPSLSPFLSNLFLHTKCYWSKVYTPLVLFFLMIDHNKITKCIPIGINFTPIFFSVYNKLFKEVRMTIICFLIYVRAITHACEICIYGDVLKSFQ